MKKLVNSVRWQYAKTYPNAPHEYTIFDWDKTKFQMLKYFARLILEKGNIEYYYKKPFKIYVIDEYKYWIMETDAKDTTLINRTYFDDNKKEKIRKFINSKEFTYQKAMTLKDIERKMGENNG